MDRVKTLAEERKREYKIRKPIVTFLELPLDEILNTRTLDMPSVELPNLDAIQYTPSSKYQASRRDIAFIVSTSITIDDIIANLKKLHPAIVDVEFFDSYTDSKLGENMHSLAFRLYYQSPEKTLTGEEINTIHATVESYIQEHYHGTIR